MTMYMECERKSPHILDFWTRWR